MSASTCRDGVVRGADIADAFEEEQREDIGLEVSRVHRATQDVGGLPEMALQLAEGDA